MSKKSKQRKINSEVAKTLRSMADVLKLNADADLLISHRVSMLESTVKQLEEKRKDKK